MKVDHNSNAGVRPSDGSDGEHELSEWVANGEAVGLDALLDVPEGILDVLAEQRRRIVLRKLREGDGRATVAELAGAVADDDDSCPSVELAAASLHHTHVPKLVDAGFVEWRRGGEAISLAVDLD
ncbi:DUF7344 domain-containing protein [Halomicrococcus sp. SG-WS-1]|uniref:DUF7344 domain-containing protein n=1 Tax=Halomicrococcus sp. SG-WS-1 TaxID=3439057 RepID=UPI003F7AC09D